MSSKASSGLFCFALLVLLVALHQVEADCLWEEKEIIILFIVNIISNFIIITIINKNKNNNNKNNKNKNNNNMMIMLQGLMVAEGEVTGFDLEKKKIEVCTKKGE